MATRYDEIEEIQKFNPYHDSQGKFTSGTGGGAASVTFRTKDPGKQHMADTAIARMKEQSASGSTTGGSGDKNEAVKATVKTLNSLPVQRPGHNGGKHATYEQIKEYDKVLSDLPAGTKLTHKMEAGTETFEKLTSGTFAFWHHTRMPWKKTDKVMQFEVAQWMADRGNITLGPIELVEGGE